MRVWSAVCSCESQKPNRSSYLIVFTPFRIVLQKGHSPLLRVLSFIFLFPMKRIIIKSLIDLYFFLVK